MRMSKPQPTSSPSIVRTCNITSKPLALQLRSKPRSALAQHDSCSTQSARLLPHPHMFCSAPPLVAILLLYRINAGICGPNKPIRSRSRIIAHPLHLARTLGDIRRQPQTLSIPSFADHSQAASVYRQGRAEWEGCCTDSR